MQNKYAGDVGDFVKLALLRHLVYDANLGVAWYLHPDENQKGDGKHIEYLKRPEVWRHLDPVLFDMLSDVMNTHRSVSELERKGVLNATFVSDPVLGPSLKASQRDQARRLWFSEICDKLASCDVVFADPDNGLIDDASQRRRQKMFAKSVPLSEVLTLAKERTAIIYHHNTRRSGGHVREISHWLRLLGNDSFAIRSRKFSGRTFFVLNPNAVLERVALNRFQSWLWLAAHNATTVMHVAKRM
jgi:hypothetical protein